jgi:hypothetical protein
VYEKKKVVQQIAAPLSIFHQNICGLRKRDRPVSFLPLPLYIREIAPVTD